MNTFIPSPQQAEFFDWVDNADGNAILEAVAGAGKTTTLVKGVERMAGNVIFLAYNAKIVNELKARIGDRARTFHSVGFQALRSILPRGSKVEGRKVRMICDAMNIDPGIADIVSMAKNRLLMPHGPEKFDGHAQQYPLWAEMVEHFNLMEKLPEMMTIDEAIVKAMRVLEASNDNLDLIDFDDMLYLPLMRGIRFPTFDWVLVDEAQDTNPARRAIAAKLLADGGRLVAVGDPRQAIYGFTGTDNDSLGQIAEQFDAVTMPLTVTYRCPKSVVKFAQQWVSHIKAHESAPEGVVRGPITRPEFMASVANGDAVLCRYNKPLVEACFALIRAGKAAKIEGRDIGANLINLCRKWKVTRLDALKDRLESYFVREINKAIDKGSESKQDFLHDQAETMSVLIDRAEAEGINTVAGLSDMIKSIFTDSEPGKPFNGVLLCSVHKSKGLEWERVFLLNREQFMPSKFARREWQIEQENNLIYVAVTRAKHELVEVVL